MQKEHRLPLEVQANLVRCQEIRVRHGGPVAERQRRILNRMWGDWLSLIYYIVCVYGTTLPGQNAAS